MLEIFGSMEKEIDKKGSWALEVGSFGYLVEYMEIKEPKGEALCLRDFKLYCLRMLYD